MDMRDKYDGFTEDEIAWLQQHPNVDGRVLDAQRWDEREEELRRQRWHAAYNAVVGAIYATWIQKGWDPNDVHEEAAEQADFVHGPLVKP
jgi:hypothetical protein